MKLGIIGKGGSGKTLISVMLIQLLSKKQKLIAIDADSNKNIIDYIFPENVEEKPELGDFKADIFKKTASASSEYNRKYFPKDGTGVFDTDESDEIFTQVVYKKDNIHLIQLGEPREARVGVTGMCPYNETIKVFLSNLREKEDEIVLVDFAAGSEVAGKGIVASFDNIIIPLEPNFKNLDVAKDIFKTLRLIGFSNVFFIFNKIRTADDEQMIRDYFAEDINVIGTIPFSKDIMKMDIKREINPDFPLLQESFGKIVESIGNMKKDAQKLDRLKQLDILKGDKKCH